jgi:hypothetical protein
MSKIKLSVLIPSIPERFEMANKLYRRLDKLRDGRDTVEILMFADDMKRSIGKKREALVQIANGKYLSFVDDDDDVADNYFKKIIDEINKGKNPDLITINSIASIEGKSFYVNVGIDNENEQVRGDGNGGYLDVKRKPFHVCVWKSKIAKRESFSDKNYGEDWDWCEKLLPKVKTHASINAYLHRYYYSKEVSQATI